MYYLTIRYIFIVFVFIISWQPAFAAEIVGFITNAETNDPLPGANVFIEGTSLGAASDIEGFYRITGVDPGTYLISVNYIGYASYKQTIEFKAGVRRVELNVELTLQTLEGETIIVTGNLEGQLAAINQQLSSNTIINVVSKERIRELPDDNAAESVARLPGVAVRRSAGEGSRVNIRGMSPKFNSITLDGERIPSTGQGRRLFHFNPPGGGTMSTLTEDRSVDLSMISSESLDGIEIFKALTPDRDADAIGGSVNFTTANAPQGLRTRVNVLGGYTGYHNSWKNVKINATVSNRFLDENLGLLFTGVYQKADRSSDNQEANWNLRGTQVRLSSVELDDTIELRDRYSANLYLDYTIGDHSELKWTNLFSRTDREIINREYSLSLTQNDGDYLSNWSKPTIYVFGSHLKGEHNLPFADLDWGFNFITTVDENDFNYGYYFQEQGVFQSLDFIEEEGPYAATQNATFRLTAYGGTPWGGGTSKRDDQNISAQLNLLRPFTLSSDFAGYVKIGGKYRAKDRSLEQTSLKGRSTTFISQYLTDHPEAEVSNSQLAISNFLGAYDPGDFFFGDHFFPITVDHKKPYDMFQKYRSIWIDVIVNEGLNNYVAKETITAAYLQAELSYQQRITLIAGARYEYEDNDYTAVWRTDITEQYEDNTPAEVSGVKKDTSGTRTIGEWFPQFHLKYRILQDRSAGSGLDLRLAYTRSIARPEFLLVAPRFHRQNGNTTIYRGRTDLKPTTSWNYDVFLTGYSKLGMLTVGYFFKDLDNVIFEYYHKVRPQDNLPAEFNSWYLVDPQNSNEDNKVWGWEFELQTNFTWLPSPFDGIVLYGNYSRIRSEVRYPWAVTKVEMVPPFRTTVIDTNRVNKLPGQADEIINLSLGYDKGRFSGRLSFYFQDETIDFITNDEKVDGFVDEYARLDFSASFRITQNFIAILNLNNILNRKDRTYIGIGNYTGRESVYGTRAEFGLRFDLR